MLNAFAFAACSIIDYDKVLVLGGGRVLEFGTPHELISKNGGAFCSMINDTGEEMANFLKGRAQSNSSLKRINAKHTGSFTGDAEFS